MKKKNDIYLKAAEHFFEAYKNNTNCGLCFHISQTTGYSDYKQPAIKEIAKLFSDDDDFTFGPYDENFSERLLALLFMHEIVNDKK